LTFSMILSAKIEPNGRQKKTLIVSLSLWSGQMIFRFVTWQGQPLNF